MASTSCRTFASSAPSGIAGQLIEHFHMSQEVATLTIALFVAGYCVGPLAWGPLSEQVSKFTLLTSVFLTEAISTDEGQFSLSLSSFTPASKLVVLFHKTLRLSSFFVYWAASLPRHL